jgi:hypothetical protein
VTNRATNGATNWVSNWEKELLIVVEGVWQCRYPRPICVSPE